MLSSRQSRGGHKISRRTFLATVAAGGAGLTISGVLALSATSAEKSITFSGDMLQLDGAVRMGELMPALARSRMLEVKSVQVAAKKKDVRADVRFRFRDDRLDGGAAFQLDLFADNGMRVASDVQTEMRNRQLIAQRRASLGSFAGDKPNRPGKAEFRFADLPSAASITRFVLRIWPVD